MAKKVKSMIKLQVPAAKATPAPPIGPALGQHGVNIPGFCKEFNERPAKEAGTDKSLAFALRVIALYKYLCAEKNEYVLSKQVLPAM